MIRLCVSDVTRARPATLPTLCGDSRMLGACRIRCCRHNRRERNKIFVCLRERTRQEAYTKSTDLSTAPRVRVPLRFFVCSYFVSHFLTRPYHGSYLVSCIPLPRVIALSSNFNRLTGRTRGFALGPCIIPLFLSKPWWVLTLLTLLTYSFTYLL